METRVWCCCLNTENSKVCVWLNGFDVLRLWLSCGRLKSRIANMLNDGCYSDNAHTQTALHGLVRQLSLCCAEVCHVVDMSNTSSARH